jgi:hypothetical protein
MRELPLTDGSVAVVDDDTYERAARYRWGISTEGYVRRKTSAGRNKEVVLHKIVMPGVARVDHRNGDKRDNRRENLRAATSAQNAQNQGKRKTATSSRFKGVTRHRTAEKWQAGITVNGRFRYLGLFTSEESAALAYDSAALAAWGDFARLNFGSPL